MIRHLFATKDLSRLARRRVRTLWSGVAAVLLLAVAACESNPAAALDRAIEGGWWRETALPTAGPVGTQIRESWIFDTNETYTREMTLLVPSTGQATAVSAEEGTWSAAGGTLSLTRLKLFERDPNVSLPPGAPGTEPKPVTPLYYTMQATVRGDELMLGGCPGEMPCFVGPVTYQRQRIDNW